MPFMQARIMQGNYGTLHLVGLMERQCRLLRGEPAMKSAYGRTIPSEDDELTHVGPGTPMGELFRRYWQPVAVSDELTDRPQRLRILGEDLVVFRDLEGRVGQIGRA